MAEGIASYYTVESSSRMTASGELLRDDALTCAMRTGEFGEYYLVVAENGKSVVVRLNDRGPFKRERVVDLSEAAMRELDLRAGLVPVRVYRLGNAPPLDPGEPGDL
jgi:rare lipoprotein A